MVLEESLDQGWELAIVLDEQDGVSHGVSLPYDFDSIRTTHTRG